MKIQYLTFDLGVKVTRNIAQYPIHHVTYSATKFEFNTFNGLGGDTFTRNVTDGRVLLDTIFVIQYLPVCIEKYFEFR